jgi:glycosyltransferase involved in cell wall biosynthesis
MNDLITVVVPNYNNDSYIVQCIESIQNQTYTDLDIVVIDDKSTDKSIEIINKLAASDERVRPIFNEANIGIAANRHKGIINAYGKYITTLDADDYLYNRSKIEREYEIMNETRQNNVLVFSNFLLVDRSGALLKHQDEKPIKEGDLLSCILSRSCKIPRDYMFTKEQYTASGGLNKKL